jgi:hypothetical protein
VSTSRSKKRGAGGDWPRRQPAWARGRRPPMPANHHDSCTHIAYLPTTTAAAPCTATTSWSRGPAHAQIGLRLAPSGVARAGATLQEESLRSACPTLRQIIFCSFIKEEYGWSTKLMISTWLKKLVVRLHLGSYCKLCIWSSDSEQPYQLRIRVKCNKMEIFGRLYFILFS